MHPRRRRGSLHIPLFDRSLRQSSGLCPWGTSSGSYCNSFVREQGHSRTVRQYDTPPRGPSCLHGVRAFQKSKFLRCRGNQHNRNSFVHISQTEWVLPSRVLGQSPLVLFVLLCVAPAPFFVASLSFFWRNANLAGRFAGRLCCFILFVQLLPLLSPSGPSLRARSATTEGKKKFSTVFSRSLWHIGNVFL